MFNGLRVVVFEDDFLLADALVDTLGNLGCCVVTSCRAFKEALDAAATIDFDVAIVDLDLGGLDASPILEKLEERQRPYLLATATENVPKRFLSAPRLTKPYDARQLEKMLGAECDRSFYLRK